MWLNSRNLKTNYHKKILPKQEGPFEIKKVLGPVTYQLKLPETWKIHNIFHAVLLWPYIENEVHGNNYPHPPPELLEKEEVYEVESILKHRWRGWGYQYYILWKGYPISDATWESETTFLLMEICWLVISNKTNYEQDRIPTPSNSMNENAS